MKSCERADIAIVGFSVTRPSTFTDTKDFLDMAFRNNCIVVVAGNQIDLVDQRKVSSEEARSLFECNNPPVRYFETSAKTGENVYAVFEYAIQEWRDHGKKNKSSNSQAPSDDPKKCVIS